MKQEQASILRRLVNTKGGSNKYYELEITCNLAAPYPWTLHRRWGRIGTSPQVKVNTFASFTDAEREMKKLIKQKKKNSYDEVIAKGGPLKTKNYGYSPSDTISGVFSSAQSMMADRVAAVSEPSDGIISVSRLATIELVDEE